MGGEQKLAFMRVFQSWDGILCGGLLLLVRIREDEETLVVLFPIFEDLQHAGLSADQVGIQILYEKSLLRLVFILLKDIGNL